MTPASSPRRQPRKRLLIVLSVGGALLGIAVPAAIGILVGTASAPDDTEAAKARLEGFRSASTRAHDIAYAKAQSRGRSRGTKVGQVRARFFGERRGGATGEKEAAAAVNKIAEEEAEVAALAEAEERSENCGAPLFIDGYCPTDEEIERENTVEGLCGGLPNEERAREEEELGIEC